MAATPDDVVEPLPSNVAKYLEEFEAELSEEAIRSPYFRRRYLFVPLVTSKKAQAERVIEFVRGDSEFATSIGKEYQQNYLKEVERPKHLVGQIVNLMHEEGYPQFKVHHHTRLWQRLNARNVGKGFG